VLGVKAAASLIETIWSLHMQDLTRSQKARVAIQSFKTIVNALALRGFFRPSGRMGQKLAECLSTLRLIRPCGHFFGLHPGHHSYSYYNTVNQSYVVKRNRYDQ